MIRYLSSILLLGLATGCRTTPDVYQCTADLLETDRAFARHSVENGPADAFSRYLEEAGIQLPSGAAPIFGRDSVVAAMAGGPEFDLDWTPRHAESARGCDLGWTWGTYEATFVDAEGATVVTTGKYVNVWRRLDDGSWRVVVDAGNGSGEPPRRFLRSAEGHVLESIAYPSARIELDESFDFVGRFDFIIEGVANGERYVFADVNEGGKVERLFLAHFEEIMPESDERFRYSFDDAMELGGFKFRQNLYDYSNAESAANNPNGEGAKTAALLREAGFEVEDGFSTSRYVMVPDVERRREMILFYVENQSASDPATMHERALASFTIEPR